MGEIVAALGFEATQAEARARELLDLGRGGLRRHLLVFPGGALGVSESAMDASLARSGDLVVAFHGFVGNWEEPGWGWSTEARQGKTDAERFATAFREQGDVAIDHLRGEYALLAVDLATSRVVAARDTFGLRPLHHARYRDGRLFASDIRPLRRLLGPRVNAAALRRLEREEAEEEETPFLGVFRFPAGATAFTRGGRGLQTRVGHRWELPETWSGEEPGGDEPPLEAVLEDLRAALAKAVRRCSLGSGPGNPLRTGVSLSGGIDSSIVWALALEEARALGLTEPEALTLRFPGSPTDEGPFVEAVIAFGGGVLHESVLPSPLPGTWLEEAAALTDSFHLPNLCLNLAVARLARNHGIDVVLTGYGGDQWFSGGPGILGELVCQGRLPAALKLGRELVRRGYWTKRRLLSEALRAPLLRILRPPEEGRESLPAWSRVGAGYRAQLQETVRQERADPLSDLADQLGSTEGVEFRSPLMDRDLVDLAVRIRDVRHIEGGQTKRLLRRVMRGRLPERVLGRDDKADFLPSLPSVACGGGRVYDVVTFWPQP